jgi:hypothetical protein
LSPSQATMRKHRRRLDASVEASGPHGFAVRKKVRSSGALLSSTASHPAFRDGCAYAPHVGWEVLGLLLFLPDQKAKNFFGGDWTAQISLNGKGKLRSASMRIWAGIASSLPGGRTGWPQKHLKNKRKSAFLLRCCYHELLPPSRTCWIAPRVLAFQLRPTRLGVSG